MARCKNGRELITQDEPGGPWRPDDMTAMVNHVDHAPVPMITVEPVQGSVPCDSCAWMSNMARYRVGGNMLACGDHIVSTLNLAFSMLDRP